MKHLLLLPFLFLFLANTFSQSVGEIVVSGQVVEVSTGKPVGIPDIEVRIIGHGWAFTDATGHFSIVLPSDKEYVLFELVGCTHPVISPYQNLINIPPSGKLDIKVCAAENKKLRSRIAALDNKVNSLKSQRTLSKRQLAAMHQALLDTILHFESRIADLENALEKKGEALEEQNEEITALEKQVELLKEELVVALQKKYLQQQQYQLEISSCLEDYLAKLKDLRDWLNHFDDYFRGPAASKDFNSTNEAYEQAWKKLNLNHANYLINIRNYWNNGLVEISAREIFQSALEDIHFRIIIKQYNRDVIGKLQELYGQPSNSRLRKEAKAGAEQVLQLLNEAIPKLEDQNSLFKRQLISSI